jgi:hypothetical protein
MFSQKSKQFMFVLLLLVTGCGSPATVAPIPTNTPFPPAPTSVLTEVQVVPNQAQYVPAQASAGLIKIYFDHSIRLIPATLDPEKQSGEIAAQYQDVVSKRSETWAGGMISKEGSLLLQINPVSQDKIITLKYPVHLSVVQTNASVDNLNMIMPMGGGGGGGGDIKVFSRLPLQTGEFDLMPEDSNPTTLSFLFPYLFNVTCQQAGMFDLIFRIPYSVTDASGLQDFADNK